MTAGEDPYAGPLWRHFLPADPFAGFDHAPYALDLQGWNQDDPAFAAVIAHVRPRLIVEIGSWKGASAAHMARLCQQQGLATRIICIDTWLGSVEFLRWRAKRPDYYAALGHVQGWPMLYFQFLANMAKSGLADMITPFPMDSANAMRWLKELGLAADMIYLDGSHEQDDVARDLEHAYAILRPGGVLLGDDYVNWPGVTAAADGFARRKRESLWGRAQKYALLKGGDARKIANLR